MSTLGQEKGHFEIDGKKVARRSWGHGAFLAVLTVVLIVFSKSVIAPLLFAAAAVGLVIIMTRYSSVTIHEGGIDVRSLWRHDVLSWSEIQRLHCYEPAHPVLSLVTPPGVRGVYFPLDLRNLESARELIAQCAGPHHPLVAGLDEALGFRARR